MATGLKTHDSVSFADGSMEADTGQNRANSETETVELDSGWWINI